MTKVVGGCEVGIRFAPDDKTPSAAKEKIAGDKTLTSNEAVLRAARPKVAESFVGYAP